MSFERKIPLEGVENARDLGGLPTKDGRQVRPHMLLRTANLFEATDHDWKLLQDTYHLKTILDFRSEHEVDNKPFQEREGLQRHWINVMPDMAGASPVVHVNDSPEAILRFLQSLEHFDTYDMYVAILSSIKGQMGYTAFFNYLLENDGQHAVLWHCNAGKDRTGIAAMFILSVLGVDEDILMQDYLDTNLYRKDKLDKVIAELSRLTDDQRILDRALGMYGVQKELLQNCMNYCKQQSGSVIRYTKEYLGLTDKKIEMLKHLYLL